MSSREHRFSQILTVAMCVIVVSLLIFSIVQTQKLATARAAASLAITQQNAKVLGTVEDILADIRGAQVRQRDAFSRLARRNEQLHGRDPAEAPSFDDLASDQPSPSRADDDDDGDDQEADRKPSRRQPAPPPRPRPKPSPTPSPTPCTVQNPLGGCLLPGRGR